MFKYSFYCLDDKEIKPIINIHLNYEKDFKYLVLEPCELGKNLNSKYKEVLEKFDAIEVSKFKEYYCINYHGINAIYIVILLLII